MKGTKGKQTLETKGRFVYKYLGVLGQTTTKEGKKEEKGRKEGRKERKEWKDRQKESQRKKGKGQKGKETLETFFKSLCVVGEEQPYIFEPKKLKI